MNTRLLMDTARAMVADDKRVLARDESHPTCHKRFAKVDIPQTEAARHAYRELLITTPGLGESISGAILFDETIRQQKTDGTPFIKVITDAGIIPGIKVDTGAKAMAVHPGEKITEGLDGLSDRLEEYFQLGARFAKWRAVITVGDDVPSRSGMEANAHVLARYAAWALSFSYGRALQQPALETWRGQETNLKAAQQALLHRARCNRAARRGEYTTALEVNQP